MKKHDALYQGIYDDLKDAEMMIHYAHKICEEDENDKPLADEIAKYALFRLNHAMEFHKLFVDTIKDEKIETDTVKDCMWDKTHEFMVEWYDSIKKKIDKY